MAAALTLMGAVACSSGTAAHTAAAGSPSADGGDQAWLAAVHQANLAEIRAGELARSKGGTAAVRNAGAMLVTDHVASDNQVTRVAKSLKLTLPKSVAPADAEAASRLGNETGAAFDHDFVSTMMTGHQKLIAKTQSELSKGTVPQIRQLAQTTLPVLQKHLATLRQAVPAG
jgi:predicted outer membrane protein